VKELKIEKALVDMCVLIPGNAGAMLVKLNPFGLVGIPDRLLLLPGGRAVFIELKTLDGGRVKTKQQRWHNRLRTLGFRVEVIWTVQQAGEFLESLL
jgi:hypothetical protein